MSNAFNSRIFGCAIIKSINSNYNADFSHQPRTLPNGTVYATDKTLKWAVRNYWKNVLEKDIFYTKSFNDKFKPRTLDERYLQLFEKFKTTIKSDKYCLFFFDGEKIEGVLPDQPKSAQIKKVFKDIDENSDLQGFKTAFETLTKKGIKTPTVSEVEKIDEEDEFFFFVDKDGKKQKIDGEKSEIENLCGMVIEAMGGGINRSEHLKDMFDCIDVRLFGGTYAGKTNISIHGACQITHGVNRFSENVIYSEQIMSPFRNPSEKNADSTMTTLGTQSKLQEGHYVHHFSVNPKNIEEDVKRVGCEGITNDDIENLKKGLRNGVTYYDSSAKAGTENELLLWVQLKEGSKLVLPSFVELVTINDDNDRTIDLTKVTTLLGKDHVKGEIEKIELYYNKGITKIDGKPAGATEIEL